MPGLILLLALCALMAAASFLAGALPLSMTLSPNQLRFLSSIGVGVLVGTSLIVIIPEGIEAATTPATASHLHRTRSLLDNGHGFGGPRARGMAASTRTAPTPILKSRQNLADPNLANQDMAEQDVAEAVRRAVSYAASRRPDEALEDDAPPHDEEEPGDEHGGGHEVPTFEIGCSLILGFVLMFLIDRLPRHVTDSLKSAPTSRSFALDTLGGGIGAGDASSADDEADGFLGSLTPTPRHARSLATTVGLVIHAAADGIAMGASSTSADVKLGFIVFIAVMIHKAPAAFGLTSVLLKQGLSKRAARGHLIVFSLAAPAGALATYLLISFLGLSSSSDSWWTGMLLLFSGGTFLYVAMHAMQEDAGSSAHDHGSVTNGYAEGGGSNLRKPKGPRMRDTLATMAGMLLPLVAQLMHSH